MTDNNSISFLHILSNMIFLYKKEIIMYSKINKLPFSNEIKNKLIFCVDKLSEVPQIKAIFLFGSYSRGEENVKSDLDILAITDDYDIPKRESRGYLHSIMNEQNIDLVFYKKSDFCNSNNIFIENVRKDCILLWKKTVI